MSDIIIVSFNFIIPFSLINVGLIIFNHHWYVFIIYQTIKEDLPINFGET